MKIVGVLLVLLVLAALAGTVIERASSTPTGRPTGTEIDAALDRVNRAIDAKLILRYDCERREAFIDGRTFRDATIDTKVGYGGSLMQACEMIPATGSFTLKDDRDGHVLMTFEAGKYDIR